MKFKLPLAVPTVETIAKLRAAAGLTQTDAAAMVYLAHRTRWAEYENGTRPIDLARWHLFLIRTGNLKAEAC